MELDKYFRNFKEYLAATHGGARVIYWQELTSEAEYIGSLKDGHIIHHVFHTKYCGAIQFVEFLEEISGMKEPPKSTSQVLKQTTAEQESLLGKYKVLLATYLSKSKRPDWEVGAVGGYYNGGTYGIEVQRNYSKCYAVSFTG